MTIRAVRAEWRRVLGALLATGMVIALGYSALRNVPHSWDRLGRQHDVYAGYTRAERDRAFGASIPMPMEIIDYWRSGLRPGDRYWVQMPAEAFSSNGDKRYVARSIAHVYLLPAIETLDLKKATVVISWDADPGLLHLKYSSQQRAGLQLIFVSRVARDA